MMGGKKMKQALLVLLCGCSGLAMWGCAGTATPPLVAENRPPQLVSLVADHTTIGLGETVTVTASATDPDGDTLSYSWTATAGLVTGSGSQITWTAPNGWGTPYIRCQVSDGRGGVDYDSVSVRVQEDAAPSIASLAVQPSVIRATGGTATVAAHILDREGTGVASAEAVVSLGGNALATLNLVRISGDNREGDYQVSYEVAPNTTDQPQTYAVTATAVDGAGHTSATANTAFTVEAIQQPPPPP
jgi:hypothetical protein